MNVLLAVSGGIAAYKSAELVRLLRKQGAAVRVVMTRSAMEFVRPLTFQALSGNPVHSELLDADEENAMGHITLARWADLMIIAPATANIIAKCSHGLTDDLLTTLYLAATCPVYIAPAMNQAMWNKAVTQENIQKLKSYGVTVIGPGQGDQACGETGFGRMSEPVEISQRLLGKPIAQCLQGLKVLISAGPTREPLDPVRYLTNRSSGKMGYALAGAALNAGAQVTLVSGPVQLAAPLNIEVIGVETAAQMYAAVISKAPEYDIYIGAAAVADYSPAAAQSEKIKKQAEQIALTLQKTRDILAEVAQLEHRPFTVGFAAETHNLEQYAQDKLARKNLDMIAANWVGRDLGGFESDQNALQVFWENGRSTLAMTDKNQLSAQLISLIAERLYEKRQLKT
ncbi:fused 4'-phosphopantothenoylcysteine decarboxylase; phosphopantothenoylcysteine synthetase, FMN-binding [Candidatus Methylobacter favarea]|uniref:Coenzyme A biosynthesis bifunctional protein CoaBC n=1 Tax=Candidatus Methylobacter favarea TaxID=2707345 RepID=A0A8S0XIN1_9GAMM|nr:bifunctional phosphopantothenoylcysteine decarboxylase/phosphopantothenate--cysteine ligase CoaBC [Candidatus Methylobacter favarea]CAA9890936.1 fused 4'-phosphopantothenoylcysteine decarboxylase; phosphopantothenoylcysteine synthetase, FMN-binding [Candidatus Methylobacter favarea]